MSSQEYYFNKQYMSSRLGWLWKVAKSLESRKYRCGFLNKLNGFHARDQVKEGLLSISYPVSMKLSDSNNRTADVPLFVKETRAGYEEAVPYTVLNEIKIMRSVIHDMFMKYRSPHFSFPVFQLMVDVGDSMEDHDKIFQDIVSSSGKINPRYKLCASSTSSEKMAIYNFMEYMHPKIYRSLQQYTVEPGRTIEDFQAVCFQVFYNLAVMETIQFRHGDLHPGNILVAHEPNYPWKALYAVDDHHMYYHKSQVFISIIDFDRSVIFSEEYPNMEIPDEALQHSPCIPTGGLPIEEKNRVTEMCWKEWNPYADWTRFLIALFYIWSFDEQIIAMLFPDESLRQDLMVVLGNFHQNLFGYPSLSELEDRVPRDVLDRMTPRQLFIRYAEQFANITGQRMVDKLTEEQVPSRAHFPGLVFFI